MSILSSVMWLALNVYFEARNQSFEGMVAVAHVTMNRKNNRHLSLKEVVWQPSQFSWTLKSDPQGQKIDLSKLDDLDAFGRAFEAAEECLKQQLAGNFFGGANHYHAANVSPAWAKKMKFIQRIDDHLFYVGK